MKVLPRLIAVSGKGGVGKTTYSLSKTLKYSNDQDIVYINFENQHIPIQLNHKNYLELDIENSTSEYVARKLGSKMIATWVTNAKFFKALYGMLPGLTHMIMLGHILDILEQNPSKTIILDCPASGHFLSILNIPSQFKNIFKLGAIVKDIDRMDALLKNPNFFQIEILTIPSELSVQESFETIKEIQKLNLPTPQLILNNSFSDTVADWENIPQYFSDKISQEKIIKQENQFHRIISHIIADSKKELIDKMKEQVS